MCRARRCHGQIQVLILMGSDSDAPIMKDAADVLRELGVTLRDDRGVGAPLAGARAAAAGRGARRAASRCSSWAPAPRRTWPAWWRAYDEARDRRAHRFVAAAGARRPAVDRADAAGRAGGDRRDRQGRRDQRRRAGRADARARRPGAAARPRRAYKEPRSSPTRVESRPAASAGAGIPETTNPESRVPAPSEIRHPHLRLPRESGRLVRDRGAVCAARGAVAAPADEADLVVVNTCSVTGAADQGARTLIRRVARATPAPASSSPAATPREQPETSPSMPRCGAARAERREGAAHQDWLRAPDLDAGRGSGRSPAGRTSSRARWGARRSAARADRLRRALRVLHHPVDARPVAQPAVEDVLRPTPERLAEAGYRETLARWRAPRIVRARPRVAVIAASPCSARSTRVPWRRDVPHQLARADGLLA